jgi:hypothetical protein
MMTALKQQGAEIRKLNNGRFGTVQAEKCRDEAIRRHSLPIPWNPK